MEQDSLLFVLVAAMVVAVAVVVHMAFHYFVLALDMEIASAV